MEKRVGGCVCVAFSFLTSSHSVAIAPGMEDTRSDDKDRRDLFLMSTDCYERQAVTTSPYSGGY